MWGGGQDQGPDALAQAKFQVEAITENFNKLADSCFKKCIAKYTEPDLSGKLHRTIFYLLF